MNTDIIPSMNIVVLRVSNTCFNKNKLISSGLEHLQHVLCKNGYEREDDQKRMAKQRKKGLSFVTLWSLFVKNGYLMVLRALIFIFEVFDRGRIDFIMTSPKRLYSLKKNLVFNPSMPKLTHLQNCILIAKGDIG